MSDEFLTSNWNFPGRPSHFLGLFLTPSGKFHMPMDPDGKDGNKLHATHKIVWKDHGDFAKNSVWHCYLFHTGPWEINTGMDKSLNAYNECETPWLFAESFQENLPALPFIVFGLTQPGLERGLPDQTTLIIAYRNQVNQLLGALHHSETVLE